MVYSDTSNLDGAVQEMERICGLGVAGISGNTNLLKSFTARFNQALDRFYSIALMADKGWLFDDINNTNLPIAVTNLISGQQDYPFASELLTAKSLFVKDPTGVFAELAEQNDPKNTYLLPSGTSGVPTKQKIIANSVLLDPIPNYNSTGGLKVVFSRNASKFIYTDTNKIPGIPSIFHPYLCRRASLPYLIDKSIDSKNDIAALILEDEGTLTKPGAIQIYMANRNQTKLSRMVPAQESNK